jgi:hypothetical protein
LFTQSILKRLAAAGKALAIVFLMGMLFLKEEPSPIPFFAAVIGGISCDAYLRLKQIFNKRNINAKEG